MKNRKKSTLKRLVLIFAATFLATYAVLIAFAESPEAISNRLNYSIFFGLCMVGLYFICKFLMILIDSLFRFAQSNFWRKIRKPLKYISIFACVVLFFMEPALIVIPLAPLIISSFLAPDPRPKEQIEQEQRDYEDFMDEHTAAYVNKDRRKARHPFNPFKH
tara:strand:- start:1484 stop:1969 length:486 start_codon:yes stop_codon:yes gene_type:complete